jgi:hypothetical protein
MRYLPLAFTRGPLLGMVMRAAAADPNRRAVCRFCGGLVPMRPEPVVQTVRCPHCWRRQRTSAAHAEVPARLAPSAFEALRGTTKWVRSWPAG